MKRRAFRSRILRSQRATLLGIHVMFLAVLNGILPSAEAAEPATSAWFEGHFTKHEFRIPMRDGVKLFTAVYTPKDFSRDYPILLQRTPYSLKPYTVDVGGKPGGFPDSYLREGFIFVRQDVRGRFASGGTFEDVRPLKDVKAGPTDTDESTDTYDTIDWLVKKVPHNNGNVGLQGISYPGFYAAEGMMNSHPALKAVSPQAPVGDMYNGDDLLHGGGFWLAHNFGFFNFFSQKLDDPTREEPRPLDYKTPDGYEFFLKGGPVGDLGDRYYKGKNSFWDSMIAHVEDATWCAQRDITPHLKNIHAAVLTVGGWFDAEDLSGTLKTYHAVERQNPGIFNALVMGPWSHGGWHGTDGESLGPVKFNARTAEFFRDEIEIPFWQRFLKGRTNIDIPEAYVFETGTRQWRKEDSWPPRGVEPKTLYFQPGGRLSFEPPTGGAGEYDEYVSDPLHPVPFTDEITIGMPKPYMIEDQRFAARRPDVVVYQTERLAEDVTIAGPITARLRVSTTGTDSDFVVKLIDVYTGDYPDPNPNPSGIRMGHYQQLVRGEPLRGKFREGYGHPKPFEPGKVTKLEWVMPDVFHTFRTGHRIMVQVQSSWFPLLDRNPQTYCDVYRAKPGDYQKATERIYREPMAASGVEVNVLPAGR